jgi:hypothetical protein
MKPTSSGIRTCSVAVATLSSVPSGTRCKKWSTRHQRTEKHEGKTCRPRDANRCKDDQVLSVEDDRHPRLALSQEGLQPRRSRTTVVFFAGGHFRVRSVTRAAEAVPLPPSAGYDHHPRSGFICRNAQCWHLLRSIGAKQLRLLQIMQQNARPPARSP